MSVDILSSPIAGLTFAADCTIEECRQHGACWTFLRMLERQTARRLPTSCGSPEAAFHLEMILVVRATEAFVDALGAALDRRDETTAVGVATEWSCGRRAESEALEEQEAS